VGKTKHTDDSHEIHARAFPVSTGCVQKQRTPDSSGREDSTLSCAVPGLLTFRNTDEPQRDASVLQRASTFLPPRLTHVPAGRRGSSPARFRLLLPSRSAWERGNRMGPAIFPRRIGGDVSTVEEKRSRSSTQQWTSSDLVGNPRGTRCSVNPLRRGKFPSVEGLRSDHGKLSPDDQVLMAGQTCSHLFRGNQLPRVDSTMSCGVFLSSILLAASFESFAFAPHHASAAPQSTYFAAVVRLKSAFAAPAASGRRMTR